MVPHMAGYAIPWPLYRLRKTNSRCWVENNVIRGAPFDIHVGGGMEFVFSKNPNFNHLTIKKPNLTHPTQL